MTEKQRKTPERAEDVIMRASDYQKFYATNVVSRLTDSDVRIDFLNEKIPEKNHFIFVADSGAILTFEAASILRDQLATLLGEREKKEGKIEVKSARRRVRRAKEVLVSGPEEIDETAGKTAPE